jgi:hypothetical protein
LKENLKGFFSIRIMPVLSEKSTSTGKMEPLGSIRFSAADITGLAAAAGNAFWTASVQEIVSKAGPW